MERNKTISSILLNNEERLLRADIRTSPAALSALIADEFIEIGSSGRIYSKQEVIEALQKEPPFEGSIAEFEGRQLTPKIFLITYRMVESQKNTAQPRMSTRSSIWKQIDGQWKIIFHQGTLSSHQ